MAYDVPRESEAMLSLLGALGAGCRGLFAGAALCINLVALLERWNALHAARTGLSLAALFFMLSPLGR